jgi:hypothetical protein
MLDPATGQWRGLAPSGGVLGPTGRLYRGVLFRWCQGVWRSDKLKPLNHADSHTANIPGDSDVVPQLVCLREQRGA